MPETLTYSLYQITRAICQVSPSFGNNINHGFIIFTQYPNSTKVEFNLKNLTPGKHGCHIHKSGDMRNGCISMGDHYNPFQGTHKDLNELGNHLGDLGNIEIDVNGDCNIISMVDNLPLTGTHNIIGRGLVIHENEDDLGKGGHPDSIKTGNSGKRIACGIIAFLD